jgi:hypothetical protein
MRNSLVKYMDFELAKEDPSIKLECRVQDLFPTTQISQDYTVCTPVDELSRACASQGRENLHVLIMTDDTGFLNV